MLESALQLIQSVEPGYIYLVLFFFAFIENVFPPSPSDVVVIVGATLIASTPIGFIPVLILTSVASALGFILMYGVGYFFGEKILRKGKIKFIHKDDLEKTDRWFARYGYWLILANRFLPGTRSVISFFSGVHELNMLRTFLFASISAFAWNALIIYFGMQLGTNIPLIDYYLTAYSKIIIGITALVIIIFVIRFFKKRKRSNSGETI